MLSVSQLSKSYGVDPVFENLSFTLNTGERLGLVGPNGSGKTTLLRIITGAERADSGSVRFTHSNPRVGYLPQGFDPGGDATLGQYLARMQGDLPALSERLEALATELSHQPEREDLQLAYDAVLEGMAQAAENAGRAPAIVSALGLDDLTQDLPLAALSGGQKTRLALAGVLVSGPQLLLLDEPTNHLDIEMLEWLENWLLNYPAAVLVVSHDRTFLDRVATGILELDPHTKTIKPYAGNYSAYIEQKMAERQRQWQAFQDQQDEISRLKASAVRMRSRATFHKNGKADIKNTDGFSAGFFADRSKETTGKAKNIEKRIEKLQTTDRIDPPPRSWEMKIEFNGSASGRDVLVLRDLSAGYGENVLLRGLNLTLRFGARVALIGPNGAGKTTLIRTVTGETRPLAGEVRLGSNVRFGYMDQEQGMLDPNLNALETLQREAALSETETRAFLSKFLFKGDDVFTPTGKMSYGERSRLMLACLVAQGCNFLILDEPINHLDIPARNRFEQALKEFEGTILAVVHDRYFIQGFATEIWDVRDHTIFVNEVRFEESDVVNG
jgi:ATP-binding cassette subfamily F protein 3